MAVPFFDLDRMERAVDKVRERLFRVALVLTKAGIDYAVAGGNAVAAWVASVDEAAVRNTPDVNIMIRREDLPQVRAALEADGFVYRHVAGIDMFVDGPEGSARDAVHLVFAGDLTPDQQEFPNLDSVENGPLRVITLESLVRMKLMANRRKDQVHLQDMISVGLIDQTWTSKYPPELALRLQAVLDDPEG